MPAFRLKARHIFLTYPRSDFQHIELYAFLKSIAPIDHCIVATELHSDGEQHLHAAVSYTRPIETRSQTRFDYEGRHPNIQKARSWHAVCAYVKKDGDYSLFDGEGQIADTDALDWSTGDFRESPYDVARRTTSRGKWIEYCIDARIPPAYGFAIWGDVSGAVPPTITDAIETDDPQLASRLRDLRLQSMPFPTEDSRSLVLIGPTGCGKTSYAKLRAPKPALFARHIDDLKHLTNQHRCVIFDDMDFGHTPRQNQIFLVDKFDSASIHMRHTVARIPAGVHRIFTGNHYMFLDDPAIDRRVLRIDL